MTLEASVTTTMLADAWKTDHCIVCLLVPRLSSSLSSYTFSSIHPSALLVFMVTSTVHNVSPTPIGFQFPRHLHSHLIPPLSCY